MFICVACTCDFCHIYSICWCCRYTAREQTSSFARVCSFWVFCCYAFYFGLLAVVVDRSLFYFSIFIPIRANGTNAPLAWRWYTQYERVPIVYVAGCLELYTENFRTVVLEHGTFHVCKAKNIKAILCFPVLWMIPTLLLISCRQFNSAVILYIEPIEAKQRRREHCNRDAISM